MIVDLLQQLRASCERRRIPLISDESEAIIKAELIAQKPKYCIEVGAAVGYSTIAIAHLIQQWWGVLYSFEVAYASYLEAQDNIRKSKLWNITLYPFDITKLSSLSTLLPTHNDFVFIDAQKSQYGNYLEKIQGYLSLENTILLDDVVKYQTKLDTLYEFLTENQIHYEILPSEEGDGIMRIVNLPSKKQG